MNRLLAKLAIAGTAGSFLSASPTAAQILPPASKAEHVEIIKGPELEFAREDLGKAFDEMMSVQAPLIESVGRRDVFAYELSNIAR